MNTTNEEHGVDLTDNRVNGHSHSEDILKTYRRADRRKSEMRRRLRAFDSALLEARKRVSALRKMVVVLAVANILTGVLTILAVMS